MKTALLVGGAVVLVGGAGYLVWRNRQAALAAATAATSAPVAVGVTSQYSTPGVTSAQLTQMMSAAGIPLNEANARTFAAQQGLTVTSSVASPQSASAIVGGVPVGRPPGFMAAVWGAKAL
jgi:ABC-type Na+ efflux pump permease subunit